MKDKYVHLIVAQKQGDQDGLVRVIAAYSSDKKATEALRFYSSLKMDSSDEYEYDHVFVLRLNLK